MNQELQLKFQNILGLTEDQIINENGKTITYVNYKECYEINIEYNENADLLLGSIYFNFGDDSFVKADNFKFYNTLEGEFEFEKQFTRNWFNIDPEQRQITLSNSELYPKGKVMDLYPIYVHSEFHGETEQIKLSPENQGAIERIDLFIEDTFA